MWAWQCLLHNQPEPQRADDDLTLDRAALADSWHTVGSLQEEEVRERLSSSCFPSVPCFGELMV